MANDKRNFKRLYKTLSSFSENIPFVTYEQDTFGIPSKLYPCKLDENAYLTMSLEPSYIRLKLITVILDAYNRSNCIELPAYELNNIERNHTFDDLDELAYSCADNLAKAFGVTLIDYDSCINFELYDVFDIFENSSENFNRMTVIFNEMGFNPDMESLMETLNKDEYFFELGDRESFQCSIQFFIETSPYAIFDMNSIKMELYNRSVLADYYAVNAFLIYGKYEGKDGYLLSIDWGCPYEAYFENVASLASIDFAALGTIIYEIKTTDFQV